MNELYIKAKACSAISCDAFTEASAEELRVLIAALSLDGAPTTVEALAELAGVSANRAKASVTLWESEGAIKLSGIDGNIIDEYDRIVEITPATEVAAVIHSEDLRSLHEEIAALLGKPALEREEIRQITSLHTEEGLSPEYILTVAHHAKQCHRLTEKAGTFFVGNILQKAKYLTAKGIDTLETLEHYIETAAQNSRDEYEIRRIMKLWDRSKELTPTQQKYYRTWMHEYCFGADIIGAARERALDNEAKRIWSYMHGILKEWYTAGCKTLEECINFDTSRRKTAKSASGQKNSKTEPKTPKYGNFDPTAALEAAIKRSFEKK